MLKFTNKCLILLSAEQTGNKRPNLLSITELKNFILVTDCQEISIYMPVFLKNVK